MGAALTIAGGALFAGDAQAQRAGNVLDFDRSSWVETEVGAGDLGIDGSNPKTIEAWAYTRTFDDSAAIFALGAPGTDQLDFALRVRGDEDEGIVDEWRAQFWGGDMDFEYPSHNEWVHFALVWTGEQAIAYANATQVATWSDATLDTEPDTPFRIGWWPHRGEDQAFDGKIAEVRVWNRAVSAAELQSNMHASLNGDEDGLVGYWPLNEGSGDVAEDWAQGNDGSFEGNPEWVFEWPFVTDLTSQIVSLGQTVTLGPVEVYDAGEDATYEWFLDGEPIAGADEAGYTITDAQLDDAGTYHVVVDDERDTTPVESAHVNVDVWENLPAAGFGALALLGAALAGGGAWVARRNRARS